MEFTKSQRDTTKPVVIDGEAIEGVKNNFKQSFDNARNRSSSYEVQIAAAKANPNSDESKIAAAEESLALVREVVELTEAIHDKAKVMSDWHTALGKPRVAENKQDVQYFWKLIGEIETFGDRYTQVCATLDRNEAETRLAREMKELAKSS